MFISLIFILSAIVVIGEDSRNKWFFEMDDAIPPSVCKEIIEAAENEPKYWDQGPDTIDYGPLFQIEVYEHSIQHPAVYRLLAPHIPNIEKFAQKYLNARKAQWIFMRKYAAKGLKGRDGVKLHTDGGKYSMTIALNTEFAGKGAWSVNGPNLLALIDPESDYKGSTNIASDPAQLKGAFFPEAVAGHGYAYRSDVMHGVAPVGSGTRYAMIIFFDNDLSVSFTNLCQDDSYQIYMKKRDSSNERDATLSFRDWSSGETHFDVGHYNDNFLVRKKGSMNTIKNFIVRDRRSEGIDPPKHEFFLKPEDCGETKEEL